MTNSPKFSSHIKNLEKHFDFENLRDFNGAKNLPGGYDPKSRFVKAFYQSQTSLEAEDAQSGLGYLYRTLSAVALPQGFIKNKSYHSITFTQYLSAYDSQSKLLTLQAADNPTVYSFGFEDVEDETKRQAIYIEEKFTPQPILN